MSKLQNAGFTLLLAGSLFSLICTLTPIAIDYHYFSRLLICIAVLITLIGWSDLKRHEVAGLLIIIVIYNPVAAIQMGNAIAWISAALTIMFFSGFKLLTNQTKSH